MSNWAQTESMARKDPSRTGAAAITATERKRSERSGKSAGSSAVRERARNFADPTSKTKQPKKRAPVKQARVIIGFGASAGGFEAFTEILRKRFLVNRLKLARNNNYILVTFKEEHPSCPECW